MPDATNPTVKSDADAIGPLGSCLICGHMRTLVVWQDNMNIGACGACRDAAVGWDALEAENDKLRKHIASLIKRVNRQMERINRAYAALDGEG